MMESKAIDNRIWIKGLCVECPRGVPLEDCPLSAIRSLPMPEFRKLINALSETKLDVIRAHCEVCMKQSEPD